MNGKSDDIAISESLQRLRGHVLQPFRDITITHSVMQRFDRIGARKNHRKGHKWPSEATSEGDSEPVNF